MSVAGLPPGTYGIRYTTTAEAVDLPPVRVEAGQAVPAAIPASGRAHRAPEAKLIPPMSRAPTRAMKIDLDAQGRRAVFWLALAAIVLYLPLIGWGLPHATTATRVKAFAVDELLPLDALAEMHNTFVVSKPDRNYGYPWWHYVGLAAVQAPYVAYLKVSGQLSGPARRRTRTACRIPSPRCAT